VAAILLVMDDRQKTTVDKNSVARAAMTVKTLGEGFIEE
jgi:hypothetical protein